jgi:hypothetical protein
LAGAHRPDHRSRCPDSEISGTASGGPSPWAVTGPCATDGQGGTSAFATWLPRPDLSIGAERRAKPGNLNPSALGNARAEDGWGEVFVAWAPSRHLWLTLAWADLGRLAPGLLARRQQGACGSIQVAR